MFVETISNRYSPEYEYEEHEECEEDRDVVHGPEHDDQLPPQVGQEPDQLQDPQQAEGAQDGDARALEVDAVHDGVVDLHRTAKGREAAVNADASSFDM